MIITNNRADWRKLAYLFLTEENGQGLVEYVVIFAVISLATTLGLTSVGKSTNNDITELQGGMDPEASEVVFETEDGERISRGFYSSYNPIVIPEVPDKAGTSGKYWSLDGETIATESSIRAAVASGERVTLTPVYTVTLIVDGDAFTISGLGDEFSGIQTHIETPVIIGKVYTIEYCGDRDFCYWRQEQSGEYGRIVSTTRSYSLSLATDLTLSGVAVDDNVSQVVFVNSHNWIVSAQSFEQAEEGLVADDIIVPNAPNYLGREFNGWSINGSNNVYETVAAAGEKTIQEMILTEIIESHTSSIIVKAEYKAPGSVTIQIIPIDEHGQRIFGLSGSDENGVIHRTGTVGYNSITVQNSELASSDTQYYIQYWLARENDSYDNALSTFNNVKYRIISEDTVTIYLVLGTTQGSQVPTAAIQSFYADITEAGVKRIIFISNYNAPEGYEVVERGAFRVANNNTPITVDNYASQGAAKKSDTDTGTGTYTLTNNLNSSSSQTSTWYFRAYMIYITPEGESEIVYSPTLSGSWDSLMAAQAN